MKIQLINDCFLKKYFLKGIGINFLSNRFFTTPDVAHPILTMKEGWDAPELVRFGSILQRVLPLYQ